MWCLRIVAWAILLLIGYRGVAAIITSYTGHKSTASNGAASTLQGRAAGAAHRGSDHRASTSPGRAASAARSGSAGQAGAASGIAGAGQNVDGFPVALAQAFALEFGQSYLSLDPGATSRRASSLAQFLPHGTSPQLGWNRKGTQSLQSEQVAGTTVLSQHTAVVTLLARVNNQLVELGVPVYASGGAMVVSGQPALLPAPASVVPPAAPKTRSDAAASAALTKELPGFFRAFAASGRTLGSYLASGTQIGGLGGMVSYSGLLRVSVAAATGRTRQATATVVWLLPSGQTGRAGRQAGHHSRAAATPAQLQMTYALTVVGHGKRWLVESIGAATGPSS